MIYRCTFRGRAIGAIGIFHDVARDVDASDPEAARLACYETHEHISGFRATPAEGAPPLCRFCNARPVPHGKRTCGAGECMSAHLAECKARAAAKSAPAPEASTPRALLFFPVKASDGRTIGHVTGETYADALRDFRRSQASTCGNSFAPSDTLGEEHDPEATAAHAREVQP